MDDQSDTTPKIAAPGDAEAKARQAALQGDLQPLAKLLRKAADSDQPLEPETLKLAADAIDPEAFPDQNTYALMGMADGDMKALVDLLKVPIPIDPEVRNMMWQMLDAEGGTNYKLVSRQRRGKEKPKFTSDKVILTIFNKIIIGQEIEGLIGGRGETEAAIHEATIKHGLSRSHCYDCLEMYREHCRDMDEDERLIND